MADETKPFHAIPFVAIIPTRGKIEHILKIYGDYELEPSDEFIDVNVTHVGNHAWEVEPIMWFSSDSVFRLRITARGPLQALRIFQAALRVALDEES